MRHSTIYRYSLHTKKSHQKCKAWLHVLYRNFLRAAPPLLATLHFWREDSIKFYYVFHYEITPKQHMPRPIRQMYSFVINRLWRRRRRRRGTFVFCCYKVISLIFWPHVATSKKTEASAAAATLYSIKSTTDYWHISTFFLLLFNRDHRDCLSTHWVNLWRNDGHSLDGNSFLLNEPTNHRMTSFAFGKNKAMDRVCTLYKKGVGMKVILLLKVLKCIF